MKAHPRLLQLGGRRFGRGKPTTLESVLLDLGLDLKATVACIGFSALDGRKTIILADADQTTITITRPGISGAVATSITIDEEPPAL